MKIYTQTHTLQTRDVDLNERWRPSAIFLSMQEAGTAHAELLGLGRSMTLKNQRVFVLSRSRLCMQSYPRLGDTVVSSTWPGQSNRFFCPRYHTFTRPDGTLLGTASTLWVLIDVHSRQIVSPLKANLPFPDTSDLQPPCPAPDKAAQIDNAVEEKRAYTSLYTDIDLNRHVNNTRYIDWLCDSLGCDALSCASIASLVVNYEKEILPGTPLTLSLRRHANNFSFLAADENTRYCEMEGTLQSVL
jgi:medium-chain acyl-[acyl-carrier-protein] hydrolase